MMAQEFSPCTLVCSKLNTAWANSIITQACLLHYINPGFDFYFQSDCSAKFVQLVNERNL